MNTPEYDRWHELLAVSEKSPGKVPSSFKNSALTKAGELCIGMTHNKSVGYYGCTYTQLNGVRDFGGSRRWDTQGSSTDGNSALLIDTVQPGVHSV